MSANWPLKIALTVCPAGLAVSSATAASAPLPSVGASLTLVTVMLEVALAVLNAVAAPWVVVSTLVPCVPLV